METTNNTNDDALTIREALARLGDRAPTRQSLYTAVNKGRIREFGDKETNPDGKRLISWASVQEYVTAGGFNSRRKLGDTSADENEAQTEEATQVITMAPAEDVTAIEDIGPSIPESEDVIPTAVTQDETSVQPSQKEDLETKSQNPDQPPKPSPVKEVSTPSSKDNPPCRTEAKANRRQPTLRALKNKLRHLDFDGTKNLRDWMDHRLLNMPRSGLTATHAAIPAAAGNQSKN